MKQHLVFDVSDAASISASDSVGAYLRASDGTLLTHTDVSGKKALDVNVTSGINVEVDLSHVDDSVRLGDGTSFFTSTSENGDIALDVHLSNTSIAVTDGAGSLTVDAVNLDIRDLVFATDKVDVSGSEVSLDATTLAALETINAVQSGTWNIATVTTLTGITNDVNIADGGNSITVDAVQLDIDDLNATDDAVSAHMKDGAGTALTSTLVGADQSLDVNITQSVDPGLSNTAIATGVTTLTAGGTAQNIIASPLSARKEVFIYNNSNKSIYIGETGVSASDGFPLFPGSYLQLKAGAAVDIEYVGATTGQEIRTLELS